MMIPELISKYIMNNQNTLLSLLLFKVTMFDFNTYAVFRFHLFRESGCEGRVSSVLLP